MAHVISVSPAGDGWVLHADDFIEDIVFPSGGRAEVAARDLARRKAAEGEPAELRIYLRGGALAGVITFQPPAMGAAA